MNNKFSALKQSNLRSIWIAEISNVLLWICNASVPHILAAPNENIENFRFQSSGLSSKHIATKFIATIENKNFSTLSFFGAFELWTTILQNDLEISGVY